MRNEDRNLVLNKLFDKGLWPYDGQNIDDATLKKLSLQEMEILTEEIEKSFASTRVSTSEKLRFWAKNLIKSLIKESAKKWNKKRPMIK